MPRRRYPRTRIYEQLVGERLFDPLAEEPPVARHADYNGDGIRDDLETAAVESAEPPTDHDYVYTDPAVDPDWSRISEPDDVDPDQFPAGWGAGPTERDQAAIDAGNA